MVNYDFYTGKGKIKAWTRGVQFEEAALAQADNLASMPFIHKHVAIMPDVHFGIGATVGSVVPTVGAIIPAAVGVDIGCGMIAQKLELNASQLPDSLAKIRSKIEATVPVGNAGWKMDHTTPGVVNTYWRPLSARFEQLCRLDPKFEKANHINHLGSLGGGNHFIELCLDENDQVWIMLHSGSRGIGNLIGRTYIEKAKEDMRKHFINLPDKDLAYFVEGTENFDDYVRAVSWAQDFAKLNREVMLSLVLGVLFDEVLDNIEGFCYDGGKTVVSCHHNYVEIENHFGKNVWLTRKGAVRAREGDMGIIPGSMGAKSYIVRGKGNPDSFNSCSHGAGRIMSRGQAKKTFTLDEHVYATRGVECRKDIDVIDETPGAYKDIDAVMEAQKDLVDIVHTLKQVLCVKG